MSDNTAPGESMCCLIFGRYLSTVVNVQELKFDLFSWIVIYLSTLYLLQIAI